jgi:hypothetical protein
VASSGQIEESTNNTTGTLDVPPFTPAGTATSSFDVFFDVFVQLDPMQPGIDLHNIAPAHLEGTISNKPPALDEMLQLAGGPIELFDSADQPTGYFLVGAKYTPNPRRLDFGDAPDTYGTLATPAANPNPGPSHSPSQLFLGRLVDVESDGQPSLNAGDDDLNSPPPSFADDEDGLTLSSFTVGLMGGLVVSASQNGFFSGWFDFNADGDFDDAGEQIANDELVLTGPNTLSFPVPANANASVDGVQTYFRGRLAAANVADTPYGFGGDGEVEDYGVVVFVPQLPLPGGPAGEFTFGVTSPNRRAYDPAVAIGYDYDVTGDTFATVELPVVGDNVYTLHVDTAGGFPADATATSCTTSSPDSPMRSVRRYPASGRPCRDSEFSASRRPRASIPPTRWASPHFYPSASARVL